MVSGLGPNRKKSNILASSSVIIYSQIFGGKYFLLIFIRPGHQRVIHNRSSQPESGRPEAIPSPLIIINKTWMIERRGPGPPSVHLRNIYILFSKK